MNKDNSLPTPKDTILVVDDTPTNLGVLFDSLEDAGYRVLVSTDGESALEVVQNISPDIILLDVMMPDIDGFETCRRLKSNSDTAKIPVIFMTALSDVYDEVKGLELGAVDYIIKPFQVETVLARLKTHLSVRRLQLNLEKQNAELDAFSHTVAHDLTNSLGTVIAYANYLNEFPEEINREELTRFSKGIEQSAQKAVNITRELLLLAGVRKGDVSIKPVDMERVIEQVMKRLDLIIEEHQAKITWPRQWPLTTGYAPWLEEVWTNYIHNGLKYGGSPPILEIGVTPQNDDGMVKFWIKDNGDGVSPQVQASLFTEFTRLDQVKVQGHGLGLSIVQRIINRLGGKVGVESEVGQGSTFYFTLPGADEMK